MKKILKQFFKKITTLLKSKDGFSMIELMIVVAIMAVLATLTASNFSGFMDKAKVTKAQTDIQTLSTTLESYKLDNGNYPSSDEGLKKLLDDGKLKRKKDVLLDPWGNQYNYRFPGQTGESYEIWSYGADGKEGGEGYNKDIKSWE
jgi:general secretion pathway protein G